MPGFYRRKDSPYWWYWWHEGRRKLYRSTGCPKLAAAHRWLQDQGTAQPAERRKRLTVALLAETYVRLRTGQGKQGKSYRVLETLWVPAFEGRLIHTLEPAEITERLEQWATAYKWTASTRNTALGQLGGLFAWAMRKGYCDSNPCQRVERLQVRNQRSTWLSPKQIAALARAAPPYDPKWAGTWADIIVLAAATGLRLGRLLDLRWADYCLDGAGRAYLIVAIDKGGTPTLKLLAGEVRAIVDRRIELGGEIGELMLPGPAGGNARSTVKRWLPHACRRAKIPYGRAERGGFTFHDLRRTMASTALAAGVGSLTVQRMGNWKDQKMLSRYAILADDKLQEAEAQVAAAVTKELRWDPEPN